MKALVFAITMTIVFTSISFGQTYCNITETEAQIPNSHSWNILKYRFDVDGQPKHWRRKEASYYINTLSNKAPPGASSAINAAADSWNASSWQGDDDFTFKPVGTTGAWANIADDKNVIAFQDFDPPGLDPIARTFYKKTEFFRRDRLKDVDTIINTKYYWATGAQQNRYDVESVMAHEFGHWLVLEHLFEGDHPTELGCDEFLATVMYYYLPPNTLRRTLHWIDDWGKWYIYSSGEVNMAPSSTPIESIPLPLQSATGQLRTRLLQNYPDPFNPNTWIPYELAEDSDVSIVIYDSHGHLVRQIDVGQQAKGHYIDKEKAVYWDGKDDNRASVASGVYFYTLQVENFSQTRRLVILK